MKHETLLLVFGVFALCWFVFVTGLWCVCSLLVCICYWSLACLLSACLYLLLVFGVFALCLFVFVTGLWRVCSCLYLSHQLVSALYSQIDIVLIPCSYFDFGT